MVAMRIKELQRELRMTSAELAALAGVDAQTVSRWRTARVLPRPSTLRDLAQKLHRPIGWFYGEKEQEFLPWPLPMRGSKAVEQVRRLYVEKGTDSAAWRKLEALLDELSSPDHFVTVPRRRS